MKPRDIFIMLGLLSIFATGFFTFINDQIGFYNTTISPDYLATYQTFNNTVRSQIDTQALKSQGLIEESEQGETATEDVITFKGITALLKLPFQSIKTISTLISDTGRKLGIPTWITATLLSIIILFITFLIASAFMRREI